MKVVILAGGFGTRLGGLTEDRPKPMVEVGGHPLLWHIMKHFAGQGYNEFVLALGYRGSVIKRYFLDYRVLHSHLTVSVADGVVRQATGCTDDWRVDLVDTGEATQTGGRLKRLADWLGGETFLMTYGDGLSDIDVPTLLAAHRAHGRLATVTTVRPPARFGHPELDGDRVLSFNEKPRTAEGWISGGFFVLEPQVLDFIDGDETVWEAGPLEALAQQDELRAYRHTGYWQCVDTQRDLRLLEQLWRTNQVPWRTWTTGAGQGPAEPIDPGLRTRVGPTTWRTRRTLPAAEDATPSCPVSPLTALPTITPPTMTS